MTDDLTVSAAEAGAARPGSFARNGEDVVLLRALGDRPGGRFIEVRADPAAEPGVLLALVDRGWVGSVVDLDDPAARPAEGGPDHPVGADGPLHAVLVASDVTQAQEGSVLRLARLRPWVLIVGLHPSRERSTLVDGLAAAGYQFCCYDGVSAYFVANEHAADLGPALSYPACARDGFGPGAVSEQLRAARRREDAAVRSALLWKQKAVQSWADTSAGDTGSLQGRRRADELAEEIERMQQTLSWRITAPLRVVRRMRPAGRA